MRVLITGGAGFIGSATGKLLLQAGHEVVVFDSLLPPVHPKTWDVHGPEGSEFIEGDIRDEDTLLAALKDTDVVIHLAAYQDFRTDWSTFFEVNAAGAARIYELIIREKLPIERVVLASTQALLGDGAYLCICGTRFYGVHRARAAMEVGEWNMRCPQCEEFTTVPIWTHENEVAPAIPYGISKLAAEQISSTLAKQYDVSTINLRYSIVQGATQSPKNAYSGVLRSVALQAYGGSDKIILFEDGKQCRDFVSIHDVANATFMAATGRIPDGEYNVGSGVSWTLTEMAKHVASFFRSEAPIVTPGIYRVGDIRHTLSDITKITTASEWKPRVDMIDCWKEYCEWLPSVLEQKSAKQIFTDALDGMLKSGAARFKKER